VFVDPFDVDEFLAQPLTARVATAGPTVRPTWYLWEDGAFWILTTPATRLLGHVRRDPAVALVDPTTVWLHVRPARLVAQDLSW